MNGFRNYLKKFMTIFYFSLLFSSFAKLQLSYFVQPSRDTNLLALLHDYELDSFFSFDNVSICLQIVCYKMIGWFSRSRLRFRIVAETRFQRGGN